VGWAVSGFELARHIADIRHAIDQPHARSFTSQSRTDRSAETSSAARDERDAVR